MHRAGFVNIVGNPNVGKSTLSNLLVGEKLSIITSKSQTTRHRIMGIVNGDDYQIVFSDTPGVLKPKFKLQESMLDFSRGALIDADVLLYVTDVVETPTKNQDFLDKVAKEKIPVLLVINKIDLLTGGQQELETLVAQWKELLPHAEIYPTSALHNFNVDNIIFHPVVVHLAEAFRHKLRPAFPYRSNRRFRQGLHFHEPLFAEAGFHRSIPVTVAEAHIMAVIYVERDSQKGIIIGHQGKKLKHVGIEARKDIEKFFEKRVFLELYVKVEKDWRNQENKLRQFGYIE